MTKRKVLYELERYIISISKRWRNFYCKWNEKKILTILILFKKMNLFPSLDKIIEILIVERNEKKIPGIFRPEENRSIRPTPRIPATIESTLPRFQPLPKKGVLSPTERFAYPRSSNFLILGTFINHVARLVSHPPQRNENIKLTRKGISQ